MKTRLALLILPIFLSFPARAHHHETFIALVIKFTATGCAVQLQFNAGGQNGFQPTDRIEVNGTELVALGSAAATINQGHTGRGDTIFLASASFINQIGLPPDQTFDDGGCDLFAPEAFFTYVIDDPLFGGPAVVIDTLLASAEFGPDSTAMVKSTPIDVPDFVDLKKNIVTMINNAGDIVSVGKDPNSGFCALNRNGSSKPGGYFFWLFLPLLIIYSLYRLISLDPPGTDG